MRKVALILLLCLLWTGERASAFFLIPYKLEILTPVRPNSEILVLKPYTAWVFLGNYFERLFGPNQSGGHVLFLLSNLHFGRDDYFKELIHPPYAWYETQIRKHPEIYGTEIERVVEGLRQNEFPNPERSSLVLITEYNDFSQPVSMLRVSLPDSNGQLDSEAHFRRRGLKRDLMHQTPKKRLVQVPFQDYPGGRTNLIEELTVAKKITLVAGAKAELKNFAMDPMSRLRFFPYLFLIARRHGMFTYGIPAPQDVESVRQLNGQDPPGVIITDLYLDCYGQKLFDLYSELGFQGYEKINNRATGNLDLFFMHADQQQFSEAVVPNILLKEPKASRLVRNTYQPVITYDEKLARILKTSNCVSEIVEAMLQRSVGELLTAPEPD